MSYSKKLMGVVILACALQFASAQTKYVTHTLKEGETLSMIAQQYNTSVGDIMRLNGMHADTKLVYGSQIKVPSTKPQTSAKKASSTAAGTPPASPAAMPSSSNEITHIVAKGETLYSVSKKFNVSLEQLRAWNNLADDNVKLGTLLIVNESGVNKFSSTSSAKPTTETAVAPAPQKEPMVENKPDNSVTTNTDNVTTNIQPAMQAVNNINAPVTADDVSSYTGEGFFASQFKERKSKNMQNVSGVSKTFKTASGWSDGKFYILANDIEPGTIVKITAGNGSAVYAKVLWNMGDMKENAGINFRISDATAAALRVNDTAGFNLNISF